MTGISVVISKKTNRVTRFYATGVVGLWIILVDHESRQAKRPNTHTATACGLPDAWTFPVWFQLSVGHHEAVFATVIGETAACEQIPPDQHGCSG